MVYKGPAILKRLLPVPNSRMRLYVLKLLKDQMCFLGRNWRKANMRIVSECVQKCGPVRRGYFSLNS